MNALLLYQLSDTVGTMVLLVAAASVVLPDRAVAWVHGLQSAPELNGGLAQVLEHDAAAGRYVVRVDGGKQMRLRRQALKA